MDKITHFRRGHSNVAAFLANAVTGNSKQRAFLERNKLCLLLSDLMQRDENMLKTCLGFFFVVVKGVDQRHFGTFSSSKSSFSLSRASGLLQYLGINSPLWLSQLFENEILGTAVTIKERHAEVKGNLCVS